MAFAALDRRRGTTILPTFHGTIKLELRPGGTTTRVTDNDEDRQAA